MATYDITISEKRDYTLTIGMCSQKAPLVGVFTTVFSLHRKPKLFKGSDFPPLQFSSQQNQWVYRQLFFDPPLEYGVVGPFPEYTVPANAEMRRPVVLSDRVNLVNSAIEQTEKWSRPASFSAGKITVVFPYGTTSTAADDFDNPSLFRYYVFGKYGAGASSFTELVSGKITLTFADGDSNDGGGGGGGDVGDLTVCSVRAV